MNYPYPPPPPRTKPGHNGLAIASLVLGILWLFGLGSLLALIFGLVALGQIDKRGQEGKGLAIAGAILGAIGTLGAGLILMLTVAVAEEVDKTEDYFDCAEAVYERDITDPAYDAEAGYAQCEELNK